MEDLSRYSFSSFFAFLDSFFAGKQSRLLQKFVEINLIFIKKN